MSRARFAMAFAEQTIAWAQDELELTREEIGQVVGANRKTIQRWVEGSSIPTPEHRRHLERVSQLRYLLEHSFRSPEVAQRWLQTPSAALQGRTPLFALTDGAIDDVIGVLGTLSSGAHR